MKNVITEFTAEQVEELSRNPYTHSVTPQRISFTLEFKQFFAEQMKIKDMTARKIMKAAGYNPDFFTSTRLTGIRTHIREEVRSPEGLKAPRGKSTEELRKEFAEKDLSRQSTDASIKELQERIVHLEEQISFLKKISFIRQQAATDNKPPE